MGGLTNANALAGGGDLGGDEALGVSGGGLNGMVLVVQRTLLFARSTVVGWGTSPAAITGQEGCNIVFNLVYSGVALQVGRVSTAAVGAEGLFSSSSGRSTPQKSSSSIKER